MVRRRRRPGRLALPALHRQPASSAIRRSSPTSSRSSPSSPRSSRTSGTGACSTWAARTCCRPTSRACSPTPSSARKDHTGLHVNLAVGYGGRGEIVDAVRSIIAKHDEEGGSLEELAASLTPEQIGEHLYTGGQPDPDLVIRTSGEQRLSDFLLWQSRAQRVLLRRSARTRPARGRLPPRDPRLRDARPPLRQLTAGSRPRHGGHRARIVTSDGPGLISGLVRRRTGLSGLGRVRAAVAGRAQRGARRRRAARLGPAHRASTSSASTSARRASSSPSCSDADAEQVVAAAVHDLRAHAGDLRARRRADALARRVPEPDRHRHPRRGRARLDRPAVARARRTDS